MSFDWKKLLGTVAPTMATALGGPLGGMATNAILGALGIKDVPPSQQEDQIAEVLAAANPEVMLKLKEAENTFKSEMKRLDIDIERIHAEDRASARQRQTIVKDRAPAILAYTLTAGFFGSLFALMNMVVQNPNLVHVMLGSLGTAWISAMVYFFGSSVGSKSKDQMLLDTKKQ